MHPLFMTTRDAPPVAALPRREGGREREQGLLTHQCHGRARHSKKSADEYKLCFLPSRRQFVPISIQCNSGLFEMCENGSPDVRHLLLLLRKLLGLRKGCRGKRISSPFSSCRG